LRKLGEHYSSGSEKIITPEATWMQKKGYQWVESDEESVPAASEEETDG
jgi:hypothetical protein